MPTKQDKKATADPVASRPTIDPFAVYTYEDAAALLGLRNARQCRELVYAGRLGHFEINRTQWRILGRHLLDFIDRNDRPAIRR